MITRPTNLALVLLATIGTIAAILQTETFAGDAQLRLASFKADNIDGRVFFWPLSSLPSFQPCPSHVVSHSLSRRALNLPSYHDISVAAIQRVCAHVIDSIE